MELVFLGIGDRLREARLGRGLTIEQAQAETRIRSHYLEALEEERFETLPGDAYARAFLRGYAGYLGLDPTELLEEFEGRFQREAVEVVPRRDGGATIPVARAGVAAAAVVLAVAAVGLAGWKLAGDGDTSPPPAARPGANPAPAPPAAAPKAPARTLVLAATRATRLEVRAGGPRGKRVWSGTLRRGQTLRLGLGKPVWLRSGTPQHLRARVGGKPRPLPRGARTVVVTADGARRGAA